MSTLQSTAESQRKAARQLRMEVPVQELLLDATRACLSGQWDRAVTVVDHALLSYPDEGELLHLKGLSLARAGICVDQTRVGDALPSLLIQLGYRVFVMNARNYICVHPARPLITLTGLEEVTRRPPPVLTERVVERAPERPQQMAHSV